MPLAGTERSVGTVGGCAERWPRSRCEGNSDHHQVERCETCGNEPVSVLSILPPPIQIG
jgi:hypothetical protein